MVHIAYGAQFSGERQPLAVGRHGGFQQGPKRGRKTELGTAPARGDDAALRVGSGGGHWMTTHQNGRNRKVGSLSFASVAELHACCASAESHLHFVLPAQL